MSPPRFAPWSRTSTTTQPRWPGSRNGCRRSMPSSDATATTRARCWPTARRWPPRPSACAVSKASATVGWSRMRGCSARSPQQPRAVLSSARGGGRAVGAAVTGGARPSSGFERTGFEVALGRRTAAQDEPAVEVGGDALGLRHERDRRGGLPLRPERRRAGPAAGPDRIGRRAEPGRAGGQGGPRRGRPHTHAGVRRDRQRGSAVGAPTRSDAACGPWPAGTRSCA